MDFRYCSECVLNVVDMLLWTSNFLFAICCILPATFNWVSNELKMHLLKLTVDLLVIRKQILYQLNLILKYPLRQMLVCCSNIAHVCMYCYLYVSCWKTSEGYVERNSGNLRVVFALQIMALFLLCVGWDGGRG